MLLRCSDVRACRLILYALPHRALAPCIRVRCAGTGMSTRAAPQRALCPRALRNDHNPRDTLALLRCVRSCLCTQAQHALALCIPVRSAWAGIGTRASPRCAAAAHASTTKLPTFRSLAIVLRRRRLPSIATPAHSRAHIAGTCRTQGAHCGDLQNGMRCTCKGAHCGDLQSGMRCTCMLLVCYHCASDLHLRVSGSSPVCPVMRAFQ